MNKIIELLEDDEQQYKNLGEIDYKTFKGKKNKIIIGDPIVTEQKLTDSGTMLTPELSAAYHDFYFYNLKLSLTLLPDVNCKFRSADLILTIQDPPGKEKKPIFLGIDPTLVEAKKVVKATSSESAKLGIKDNLFKIFTTELGGSVGKEIQYEKFDATIQAIGKQGQTTGWRFQISETREIAICSPDLKILLAIPANQVCKIKFSVVARIDIESGVDKLLTRLFSSNSDPAIETDFQVPVQ